jgi:IS30 family transposase
LVQARSQISALISAQISRSEIATFTGYHLKTIDRWGKRHSRQAKIINLLITIN